MRSQASIGVAALIAAIVAWQSFFVVSERELAIVTQFGEFKRTILNAGLQWKVPFIQQVHTMESRILGSDAPAAEYLTLDKKRLVADPITRWRIVDPLRFFQVLGNETAAKARIDDIVNSELRREVASHDFGTIIGNARDPLMQTVAQRVRKQTAEFGVEIVDVRIKRADLPKEVQESVFERMRAERERVAKQYRSEGEEEAAKIRADTDKERTIILAKAYEEAQKARGVGDAESVRVYAEAYGKDPEFYAFTRSLQAYEGSLDEKATLALSTGSDLFKYLGQPGKRR